MLTVMCPNCRHRFPAPGCCEPELKKDHHPVLHANFNGQPHRASFQGQAQGQNGLVGDHFGVNRQQSNLDVGGVEFEQARTGQGRTNLDSSCFYGGFIVPRGCVEEPCFINGPAIIHQPIIQSFGPVFQAIDPENRSNKAADPSIDRFELKPRIDLDGAKYFGQDPSRNSQNQFDVLRAIGQNRKIDLESPRIELQNCRIDLNQQALPKDPRFTQFIDPAKVFEADRHTGACRLTTTCDLNGGSVTITTPGIQSGGCLIQSTDSGILTQTPHVEIRPALSGGGCFVQKNADTIVNLGAKFEDSLNESPRGNHGHRMFLTPPTGCLELPGSRRTLQKDTPEDRRFPDNNIGFLDPQSHEGFAEQGRTNGNVRCCNAAQNLHQSNRDSSILDPGSRGVQIQVNTTVQLPASLGQCTVNITATTNTPSPASNPNPNPRKNNFNGGGLIQENDPGNEEDFEERRRTPTTPVSWLMPCPWSFDYVMDYNVAGLAEVKRRLQTGGWYHEGLSWQQSENLLKGAEIGRWLMRDSSDSRFIFAVSVQTARGPTSVRVHYIFGRFRLDAEPRLAFAMPLFDCPIKMLEYYVDYSKSINEHRKEVWVDYSGRLYSEIYLTSPLIKEVRSLSHLARLAVNRCKLPTHHLPPLIKNYLAEYPYTI